MASLTFHTSAGDLTADASSTVLPATEGLDRSFAGTGALLLPLSDWFPYVHVIHGATLLNNGMSLAMWDEFYNLLVVSSEGQPWSPAIGSPTTVDSWQLSWISAVRAGGPGQGIYALVSPSGVLNVSAVVRFFDDGTRDTAFAGTGALVFDDFLSAQYGGVEVQPSGRVLVIGAGVRAFRPSGEEDLAYRTSLTPLADLNRGVIRAIDDGGRLYVATASGVVRLGVDGGIDPGFSFSGSVEALAVDRDQRLLVGASGKLWRLDEGGAAAAIPLAPQPELAARLFGIAVDMRGRILLTSSTGAVLRTLADGTFDGRVGFAEGGAQAVACPRQAGCLIAGTLYEGEVNVARPSGTNVDESYVLRLAP
jgi:hypothetical protein